MVASTATSKSQSGVDRESSELDCKATARCVFSSVHLFDVSPSSSSWAHSTDSASKERNPCKQEPTSASRGHFLEPHFPPFFPKNAEKNGETFFGAEAEKSENGGRKLLSGVV